MLLSGPEIFCGLPYIRVHLVPVSTKAIIFLFISRGPVNSELNMGPLILPPHPPRSTFYTWGMRDTYPEQEYVPETSAAAGRAQEVVGMSLNHFSGLTVFHWPTNIALGC